MKSRNNASHLVDFELVARSGAPEISRERPKVSRSAVEPAPPAAQALESLAAALDAALVRVWIVGPGDLCPSCPHRPECPDQTRCLHLVASVGATGHVGGKYRRFPIGARAVGEVARSRRPFVTNDGLSAVGLAEPDWLSHHRVRSFAAIAIARGDTTLGVIAVFARRPIADAEVPLLEAFAAAVGASLSPAGEVPESALRPLAEIERDAIEAVLRHTSGRISGPRGAAAILAMRPTTLESRMKKLGVRRPERAGRRA